MISAITSTPVEQHEFTEGFIKEGLSGCDAAVVDCNLSTDTLDTIVRLCNGLKIPVYCAAVSEVKSLRTLSITGHVEATFLNRREAFYLKKEALPDAERYEDLAAQLNTTLFITRDQEGILIVSSEGSEAISPARVQGTQGNRLGMGDAFLSAVVYHCVVNGSSFAEASNKALEYVSRISERNNCNAGPVQAVESILTALDKNASIDAMTGLINRRASEDILRLTVKQATKKRSQMCVIIIDVDHFKSINDTYGHPIGDEVLMRIAAILQGAVRDVDSSGRWGGEEFLVVLPDASVEIASKVAERICHTVQENVLTPRPVTVSCGVASIQHVESFTDLVKRADDALYQAKKTGRNRVVVHDKKEVTESPSA
jgi:diguanylate cyclase (GGDEF)-like protein